jgi:hypothetical protein
VPLKLVTVTFSITLLVRYTKSITLAVSRFATVTFRIIVLFENMLERPVTPFTTVLSLNVIFTL